MQNQTYPQNPIQIPPPLSPRQRQVLRLYAKGLTQLEVAKQLKISKHTIANHLKDIHYKLNALNTTHAVAIALALNYL